MSSQIGSRIKLICRTCGRLISAKTPKHGDGIEFLARRHRAPTGERCKDYLTYHYSQAMENPQITLDQAQRLQAIRTVKNDPDLLSLLVEYAKYEFSPTYVVRHGIETDEELALDWLNQEEKVLAQLTN